MSDRGGFERAALVALASTAALLTVAMVWHLLGGAEPAAAVGATALLHFLVPALAGFIALMRGRDPGANRPAWHLLGSSLLVIAVGFGVGSYGYYGNRTGLIEVVSLAATLVGYPMAFSGLARLASDRHDFGGNRIWLDALVMGLGAYSLGIALFSNWLAGQPPSTHPDKLAGQAAFVALDGFILALCLAVASRFNWRLPTSWWLVMAAFAVFGAGDTALLALAALAQDRYPNSLFEVPLAFLLLGLAAYADRGMPAPGGPRRDVRYTVPNLAVLASLAVLVWRPDGPLAAAAIGGATVSIGASVARITLASRDNRRLAEAYRTARTDDLTGLPNRRALLDAHVPADAPLAVVALDINRFQDINATFGLGAGDRLLLQLGQRLQAQVHHPNVVARLGADEFAVLLHGQDASAALTTAERLLSIIEEPVTLEGVAVHLTASAGIALRGERSVDMAALLREADFSMHRAKADGPGIVRIADGDASALSKERLLRRSQLRASMDAGGDDFVVHYQPVMHLRDGSVPSVEALVRWRHDGEVLAPGAFLPDLDAAGLLPALTHLMLQRALQELDAHGLTQRVAVNVPPELVGDWLSNAVEAALHSSGVEPSRLTIEITEDALMRDPATATGTLAALRGAGVRVLLDDFGTGWSGLSTLRDLTVDGLKIDRSFVVKAREDEGAMAILESVTALARSLGLLTIAEGAEDETALRLLREHGVDYVQGYVVARPLPIQALADWLREHAAAHAASVATS